MANSEALKVSMLFFMPKSFSLCTNGHFSSISYAWSGDIQANGTRSTLAGRSSHRINAGGHDYRR
jgi:hypothetical protein